MAERDKPSSLSQADSTEPIMIQGKPLEMPKRNILRYRLSLNVFKALSKTAALGKNTKAYWAMNHSEKQ